MRIRISFGDHMRVPFAIGLTAGIIWLSSLHSDEKPRLLDYKSNVYSQFGEDGIIEKIFDIIGRESKVCIEFGAADGFSLSNTAKLWSREGWTGVLIESDPNRFIHLQENVKDYPCKLLLEKVGMREDSLESILAKHQLSFAAVDFLSIDIDSDDYYVFQSLNYLRPRLVLCEYNPTFPPELDVYPEYRKNYMGCSLGALNRIAKEKGYTLVAVTDTNAFFVRNDEFTKLTGFETDLSKIKITRYLRYLVTDYAGNYATISSSDFVEPYGSVTPLTDKLNGDYKLYTNTN